MRSARVALLLVLTCGAAYAQGNASLPPRIGALVPPGTKLVSQRFTGAPTMAVADFTAERRIDVVRTVEYSLEVMAFDNSSPAWKFRESAHRKQMEDQIADARSGLAPETANQGLFTADPVKETKKAWGSALSQRISMHPPRAKAYVEYSCAYFGMVGGIVVKLHVHGVPDDPGEADRWAEGVFQAVSKLSVSTIGAR